MEITESVGVLNAYDQTPAVFSSHPPRSLGKSDPIPGTSAPIARFPYIASEEVFLRPLEGERRRNRSKLLPRLPHFSSCLAFRSGGYSSRFLILPP